jgi:hypothetical protein
LISKLTAGLAYLLLFPCLGVFYFGLFLWSDIRVGDFKLFDSRMFGSPDVTNLIEIPIAAALGLLSAMGLAIEIYTSRIRKEESVSRWVIATYIAVALFYLLMPALPH